MQFEYHYFGQSQVQGSASKTGLSFAPDTSRPATFFDGQLSQRVPFREAISALHDVVVSDLRFKPKDRTEYLLWRAQQDDIDWADLNRQRGTVASQIKTVQAELTGLQQSQGTRMRPFYKARQRYFDYLYKRDYDAWFVLDPVITVHPDELFFECFSQDEASYGRLSCGYEVFEQLGERACGTTNVDYCAALYDEFQKIREYKLTSLTVDPQGFDVKTTGQAAYREVKIDLPDSWVRGFLQVSSAMTLPAVEFDLHPMDVHNLCFVLRRHKERTGPRSLRFRLTPDAPIEIELEPWGRVIRCARSIYTGRDATEIRIWGRRRLHTLERLIPVTKRFRVRLMGSGMPSFWVADMGDMSFTLGLSGWTANDWSQNANFDLLAPRSEVDVDQSTRERVLGALGEVWRATPAELATSLGLDQQLVSQTLGLYTQAGRVMYDVVKQCYRLRELTTTPLPIDALRFTSEGEKKATQLVDAKMLRNLEITHGTQGRVNLFGTVDAGSGPLAVSVALDGDGRVVGAECTCSHYVRNRLNRGPCEHMLALRIAFQRRARIQSAAQLS